MKMKVILTAFSSAYECSLAALVHTYVTNCTVTMILFSGMKKYNHM